MPMNRVRPHHVQEAVFADNRFALSAMGRKTARIKRLQALIRKHYIIADAEIHADATRPGWDDDYTPQPEVTVIFFGTPNVL